VTGSQRVGWSAAALRIGQHRVDGFLVDDLAAAERAVAVVKGSLGESSSAGRRPADEAGRRPLGHLTRSRAHDADIEATAPCVSMLFDEVGMALAEFASETDVGAPASWWESVALEAADLPNLACTWLNELVAHADRHRAEFVDVAVDRVDSPADGPGGGWRLQGRIGLRPFGRRGASSRHTLPATAAGLSVQEAEGTWTLRAHLDLA
jgi:SHS2 domain-containing protein